MKKNEEIFPPSRIFFIFEKKSVHEKTEKKSPTFSFFIHSIPSHSLAIVLIKIKISTRNKIINLTCCSGCVGGFGWDREKTLMIWLRVCLVVFFLFCILFISRSIIYTATLKSFYGLFCNNN